MIEEKKLVMDQSTISIRPASKNKVDKLFSINLTGCAILLEKAIIKIIFKLNKLHYFNTHYKVGDVQKIIPRFFTKYPERLFFAYNFAHPVLIVVSII